MVPAGAFFRRLDAGLTARNLQQSGQGHASQILRYGRELPDKLAKIIELVVARGCSVYIDDDRFVLLSQR